MGRKHECGDMLINLDKRTTIIVVLRIVTFFASEKVICMGLSTTFVVEV